MKNILLFLIAVLVLSGCYREDAGKNLTSVNKPAISEDKMVDIITDMYLAQATLKYYQDKRISFSESNEKLHYMVFKKHGLTREEFEAAFEYYRFDLEAYDRLMEKVIENLVRLESEIQADTVR